MKSNAPTPLILTYENLFNVVGRNIQETQYLRGVSQPIHSKITTEWIKFNNRKGGNPSAAQVADFAKQIDVMYENYFVLPGF